jgi:hypothetical protein
MPPVEAAAPETEPLETSRFVAAEVEPLGIEHESTESVALAHSARPGRRSSGTTEPARRAAPPADDRSSTAPAEVAEPAAEGELFRRVAETRAPSLALRPFLARPAASVEPESTLQVPPQVTVARWDVRREPVLPLSAPTRPEPPKLVPVVFAAAARRGLETAAETVAAADQRDLGPRLLGPGPDRSRPSVQRALETAQAPPKRAVRPAYTRESEAAPTRTPLVDDLVPVEPSPRSVEPPFLPAIDAAQAEPTTPLLAPEPASVAAPYVGPLVPRQPEHIVPSPAIPPRAEPDRVDAVALAGELYEHVRARLTTELLLDRERSCLPIDSS